MIISNFAEHLNLNIVFEPKKDVSDVSIEGVYIGDLLSIVMAKAKQNYVWITIQTHINVIAVAELLELSCIIIVEDMEIEQETIEKAKELGIHIYKTSKSAYEIAGRLHTLGIK